MEALKDSLEHYLLIAQMKALDNFKWALNIFNVKRKTLSLNLKVTYYVLTDMTLHSELKNCLSKEKFAKVFVLLDMSIPNFVSERKINFAAFLNDIFL